MNKLTDIENQIQRLSNDLEDQTVEIKNAINQDTYNEIIADLITAGKAYDDYLLNQSPGLHEKLINHYSSAEGFANDLDHLEFHIGEYFDTIQQLNKGSCLYNGEGKNLYSYRLVIIITIKLVVSPQSRSLSIIGTSLVFF